MIADRHWVLSLVAIVTLGPSSLAAQQVDLEAAQWLSGCWAVTSENRVAEEQWMAPHGGLMIGMARSVRDGVAVGYEFLLIRQVEDHVVFSAHPSGQRPTDFTATSMTEHMLRFENPLHDFPQKIEYHRLSQDRITARVFGEVDASVPAFELPYEGVPCGQVAAP